MQSKKTPEEAGKAYKTGPMRSPPAPALNTASALISAKSAPRGVPYKGRGPVKIDGASQGEGKLKLVSVHTDETGS